MSENDQDLFFNNRHDKPCDVCGQGSFLGFYVHRRCPNPCHKFYWLCYKCNEKVKRGEVHQKVCLLPNHLKKRAQELPFPLPPLPQIRCTPNPQGGQNLALP